MLKQLIQIALYQSLAFVVMAAPLSRDEATKYMFSRMRDTMLEPKANVDPGKMAFSEDEKMQFCLDVRGWVVPTSKMFSILFELGFKNGWGAEDYREVDVWVGHGLGASLIHLFETSKAPRLSDLKAYLQRAYNKTNVACHLPCSFRQYNQLMVDVTPSMRERAAKVCQPNCGLPKAPVVDSDRYQCRCVILDDKEACTRLSEGERQAVEQEKDRLYYELKGVQEEREALHNNMMEMIKNSKIFEEDEGFIDTISRFIRPTS